MNNLHIASALINRFRECPHTVSVYAYILILFLLALFAILLWKKRKQPFTNIKLSILKPDKRILGVLVCASFLTFVLAFVLSLCWIQHDDWQVIHLRTFPLWTRFHIAMESYYCNISRLPNFILFSTGLSLSCWEKFVLIPLAVALLPFCLFRLTKRSGESIRGARGVAFYVFFFCLSLVGVCTEPWRNYWCWAAAVVYLFVAVYTLFFLSFYRTDQVDKQDTILGIAGLFLLGVACGWGNECITVLLVPGLCLYAAHSFISHKKWSASRYAGCLGAVCGAVMLFAPPSLMLRREGLREAVAKSAHHFSHEWVGDFVANFSYEKMSLLESGKQYYLYDLPLAAKLRILPFFADYYWSCCMVGCVAFLVLVMLTAMKNKAAGKTICSALVFFVMSWIMAAAYMQSVIPQKMSFYFPCILIIAGSSFLFLRLSVRTWVPVLLAVAMLAATVSILGPGIVEAYHYKKYETMRFADMEKQRAEGIQDVVLPFRPDKMPENKTCMIGYSWYDLSDKTGGYPNNVVAQIMGVRSVRQLKAPRQGGDDTSPNGTEPAE